MKFLALVAAASALRLSACDCQKTKSNQDSSCNNSQYDSACGALTASVATCCSGGVSTGALVSTNSGCSNYTGCA
jgi:Tfp pilus assembly protein PilX